MEQAPGSTSPARPERTDDALRWVLLILVAAVIGLAALFAYSVWQGKQAENSATPAQRALAGMREFVRKNPNSAAGRVRYGEALASAGLYEDSLEQFKAALQIEEGHTGAWLDMGLVAMKLDERTDAEKYFQKVVDLTGGSDMEDINQRRETALFHLGEIALDAKRYEDAAGYFKESIRIRKDASDTYYLLAQALYHLDDANGAVKRLDAALAFDPSYAEAHYLYGQIRLEQGDKLNAARHLAKAAEFAPENQEAQQAVEQFGTAEDALERANTALKAKQLDKALDEIKMAWALDDKDPVIAIAYARIQLANGNLKGAKTAVDIALKLDATNAEAKKLQAELEK